MQEQAEKYKSLWLAVSGGDESAFSELFVMLFPKLYQFALQYTKDESLAEDVVQQVFLKCWERKSSLKNIKNIAGYLNSCTKNEVMDLLRKRIVHSKYKSYIENQRIYEQLPAETNQEERLERQTEIYNAAISHLTAQQKRVYQLSKERGWSHAKIASELNVSIHTVKWHSSAAIQTLSHFLKSHKNDLFFFSALIFFFS